MSSTRYTPSANYRGTHVMFWAVHGVSKGSAAPQTEEKCFRVKKKIHLLLRNSSLQSGEGPGCKAGT